MHRACPGTSYVLTRRQNDVTAAARLKRPLMCAPRYKKERTNQGLPAPLFWSASQPEVFSRVRRGVVGRPFRRSVGFLVLVTSRFLYQERERDCGSPSGKTAGPEANCLRDPEQNQFVKKKKIVRFRRFLCASAFGEKDSTEMDVSHFRKEMIVQSWIGEE